MKRRRNQCVLLYLQENMTEEMSQSVNYNEISDDDCVSKVLGKGLEVNVA